MFNSSLQQQPDYPAALASLQHMDIDSLKVIPTSKILLDWEVRSRILWTEQLYRSPCIFDVGVLSTAVPVFGILILIRMDPL
jgi:hypothetical protein